MAVLSDALLNGARYEVRYKDSAAGFTALEMSISKVSVLPAFVAPGFATRLFVRAYDKDGNRGAQHGSDDGHPGVGPVAISLAADRQDGMHEARAEVPGGIDGVAGGSAEAESDGQHQQGHGQGAE